MKVIDVVNTPVTELGESPFFQGQDVVVFTTGTGVLQGSPDGTTGWTAIGVPLTANTFAMRTLTFPYIRASTGTIQILNN